jgi:uncharacterized protein (TIGR03086 family)
VDIAALHRQALDATGIIVAAIQADQWEVPTPCEAWDVRTLMTHIVGGNYWAVELASGKTIADVGDRLDGDVLGADPVGAYNASSQAAAAVFEKPGALDAPCAVSYGPIPGSVYAGHRFLDVLIHGWDLAKATGQNTKLDPALVIACREVVDPQLGMIQGSGMFGNPAGAPDNADPQTQLLAILGRA